MGALDEQNMRFNISYKNRIANYVAENYAEVNDTYEAKYLELFREHPTRDTFDKETIVNELLKNDDLLSYLFDSSRRCSPLEVT